MPARPFRFGLHFWSLPEENWRERVRHYEALGYSSVTFTDHLVVPQWDPLVAAGAVAAATTEIHVGTLVLDLALRNPVFVARAAATVEEVSGGRLELGLGAGYVKRNFLAAGLPFPPAGERIAQLEEAIAVLRRLWTEPSTSVKGRFYELEGASMAGHRALDPWLVIGGGGPRMMRLGGRTADTVSMIPRQSTGDWSVEESMADSTLARMAEKAAWVRRGAEEKGRDPERIELNTMAVRVIVGDDVGAVLKDEATSAGVSVGQLLDSSLYVCGNGDDVCDHLLRWREQTGISYFSFFDPGDEQIEYLAAQVLSRLNGG